MAKCDTTGSRGGGRCPICEAPSEHRVRPFCSKRCQDVDLGRWLRGNYRIPTEEAPGEEPAEDDGDDSLYSGRA
jgi:endogenous inhibitor of DNA gyrase (YacG/DUF329 family)